MLDAVLEHVPARQPRRAAADSRREPRCQRYVGRIAIGRIFNGRVKIGDPVVVCKLDDAIHETKVTKHAFDGLKRIDIQKGPPATSSASPVSRTSRSARRCRRRAPHRYLAVAIDEPTVPIVFGVNTSPVAAVRAAYPRQPRTGWTGAARKRLDPGRADGHAGADEGRQARRAAVVDPHRDDAARRLRSGVATDIVTKEINGQLVEPVEELVIDVPEDHQGSSSRGWRAARLDDEDGEQRQRTRAARIPDSGPRAHRSAQFLTDTSTDHEHIFSSWEPWHGNSVPRERRAGRRPGGVATAYAISTRRSAADLHRSGPYRLRGMIIGENARTATWTSTSRREADEHARPARTGDSAHPATQARSGTGVEFINDDELVR